MDNTDKSKWDKRYLASTTLFSELLPSQVLQENQHLLPAKGDALDLACGLGANALFLAQCGLNVSAWDVSSVAIEKLRANAKAQSLNVDCQVHDVLALPPHATSFDVIIVSRFLERKMFPFLIAALKPAGLLYYQTFITDKNEGVGPSNPDYLLSENELLSLCAGMRVLVYREEGGVGKSEKGFRGEAMIVAQKKQ